ncbi:helix-turn-helix transcriptional regulator [Paenibacillus sp. FSL M7-0802]|uniref:helix-turn-helix domain-containing protein n=1 Tax=Paenibacillus sp. FSL M7-0802 TaxID=2921536 RepID=UPI0030F9021D
MTKIFVFEYNVIKEVRVIYKLKKKRKEKGWTQLELSEKSGVPQPTISQIEKGNRKYPTHENIRKLAKALEVDIRELEDESEDKATV